MPTFRDKVKFDATALRSTEKALLVQIDGEEHWIPHSQIDDDSEVYKAGDAGELVISEWIAKEKKLV